MFFSAPKAYIYATRFALSLESRCRSRPVRPKAGVSFEFSPSNGVVCHNRGVHTFFRLFFLSTISGLEFALCPYNLGFGLVTPSESALRDRDLVKGV
jgi:hypothetical protein